jgi:hypothetical protein
VSDDEEAPRADVPAGTGAARRGTAWMILGVVAAALLICCCSAAIGVAVSWSAGLFDAR